MTTFLSVRSRAVLLDETNVDTDQIIPAQHVNARGKDRLAAAFFANRRAGEPSFPFNDTANAGREILVVGPNFGCGSSREAAAWAIGAWGIRALVGTTFNDTFNNNCLQNAILPVPLAADAWSRLAALLREAADEEMTVDLAESTVIFAGQVFAFEINQFRREMLLSGMDELSYILARSEKIRSYESGRSA